MESTCKVNCSVHVHDNEGTCHQVQLCGSLIVLDHFWTTIGGLYRTGSCFIRFFTTQTILDELIVCFGIFIGLQ